MERNIILGVVVVGILVVISLMLYGCAGTSPTPEQVNAYANAAHTVVHGAVQDAKEIRPLIKK